MAFFFFLSRKNFFQATLMNKKKVRLIDHWLSIAVKKLQNGNNEKFLEVEDCTGYEKKGIISFALEMK